MLASASKHVDLGHAEGRFSDALRAQETWGHRRKEDAHVRCLFLEWDVSLSHSFTAHPRSVLSETLPSARKVSLQPSGAPPKCFYKPEMAFNKSFCSEICFFFLTEEGIENLPMIEKYKGHKI